MSYPEWNPMAQIAPRMQASLEQGVGGAFSLNDDPSEDQKLPVRFYWDARPNTEESKKAGRLISEKVEMYEIVLPSAYGKHDVRRGEVSDKERQRFPRAYGAFRAGADQGAAVGTPLRDWPVISTDPNVVAEANHIGLQTVEHLASLSDGTCQQLGAGWLSMRQKAKDWLAKAKDGAILNRLREESDEWRRRAETQEKLIAQLNEKLTAISGGAPLTEPSPAVDIAALVRDSVAAALAAQPKKKPGRPPKVKPEDVS